MHYLKMNVLIALQSTMDHVIDMSALFIRKIRRADTRIVHEIQLRSVIIACIMVGK